MACGDVDYLSEPSHPLKVAYFPFGPIKSSVKFVNEMIWNRVEKMF